MQRHETKWPITYRRTGSKTDGRTDRRTWCERKGGDNCRVRFLSLLFNIGNAKMWETININRAEIQLFKIYIYIYLYILYELFMLSVEKCRQRIEKCLYNCELRIVVVVVAAAFGQSLAINQAAQYDRRRLVSESQSPSPSSDLPGDCD